MKHKVLGSMFVVAVALGLAAVTLRTKDEHPAAPPRVAKTPDATARPLASYRVQETPIENGMAFRGTDYVATVAQSGVSFGSKQAAITFGSPRLEQGGLALELEKGSFSRPAFGVARLDRGALQEEYVFENNRMEQLFRIPTPLAEGALTVSFPAQNGFGGPVATHGPGSKRFSDMTLVNGALEFKGGDDQVKAHYYGAVAVDALDRRVALVPRFENGAISLTVPADFMKGAVYPLVVDPWLSLADSFASTGVSANAGTSDRPALILNAGFPTIAWADDSSGNFEIYIRSWNGFEFRDLGNLASSSGGGISSNSGKSTLPVIAEGGQGLYVAWQDESRGIMSIFAKMLDRKDNAWKEVFAGSASTTGVNGSGGLAQHPSLAVMQGVVPATPAIPASTVDCPVFVWDELTTTGTQVLGKFFYPGRATATLAVPAGFYTLGLPSGFPQDPKFNYGTSISQAPPGATAEFPSVTVDSSNRIAVAWQDTRNGNYEIMVRRYNGTSVSGMTLDVDAGLNGYVMNPAGTFLGISGSDAAGGISATPSPSQFPELVSDGLNLTVVWQETNSAAPPVPPGTQSHVFLARSDGAGAFTGLGGSATPGGSGIDQAGAGFSATAPSVDVNGNTIAVAWADDSNGRSSIYVRTWFLGDGVAPPSTTWEQVGFETSAFPAINAETQAIVGGISLSNNFAIQPKIRLDFFGVPTVVWSDGSLANFDVRLKQFSANAPGNADLATPAFGVVLRQSDQDPRVGPVTDLPVAGFAAGTDIYLYAPVFSETLRPPGTTLALEVEIQPQGTPFIGTLTKQSLFVAPDLPTGLVNAQAVAHIGGLPNKNYHWQARTVDQRARHSPWFAAGASSGVSFRINTNNPPPGGGGGGGGGNGPGNSGSVTGSTRSKGSCGLTGLEAVALLGVAALLRRRSRQ